MITKKVKILLKIPKSRKWFFRQFSYNLWNHTFARKKIRSQFSSVFSSNKLFEKLFFRVLGDKFVITGSPIVNMRFCDNFQAKHQFCIGFHEIFSKNAQKYFFKKFIWWKNQRESTSNLFPSKSMVPEILGKLSKKSFSWLGYF